MDHVLVLLGVALDVAHVPAEGLEEGVDELDAHAGLFVVGPLVDVQVAGEAFDQPFDVDPCLGVGYTHSAFLQTLLLPRSTWPSTHSILQPCAEVKSKTAPVSRGGLVSVSVTAGKSVSLGLALCGLAGVVGG